jgi:hypothetical protein
MDSKIRISKDLHAAVSVVTSADYEVFPVGGEAVLWTVHTAHYYASLYRLSSISLQKQLKTTISDVKKPHSV